MFIFENEDAFFRLTDLQMKDVPTEKRRRVASVQRMWNTR